jgi:hypothetical protein
MYDFILEFHNMKFYFVSLIVYVIKWNLLTSILVSWGFIFLETVYTWFHLDETHHLSFFINSLQCHKKYYMVAHLLKMKLSLGVTLVLTD